MESYPLANGSRLHGLVRVKAARQLSPATRTELQPGGIGGAEARLLARFGEGEGSRRRHTSKPRAWTYVPRPRWF
jgi:hypothetical protein